MILADKIIEERKKLGWSQEDLADKLDVSRQSVSKWEGAQSVPDINRIIQMAEIFGVSTDYLLKDDAVKEDNKQEANENVENARDIRTVSMEEAANFIKLRKKWAPRYALATMLCVLSPTPMIFLVGCSEDKIFEISEETASLFGIIILFLLIAVAVFMFIKGDNELEPYEYMTRKEIDTAYGVDGLAKERRQKYQNTYNTFMTVGVIMCILCSVPLIIAAFLTGNNLVIISMVDVLLIIVSIATYIFVKISTIRETYDMLLQEGEYTVALKKVSPLLSKISASYWIITVAVFLGISLFNNSWNKSWIVFVIAGVLYAAVMLITKALLKVDD